MRPAIKAEFRKLLSIRSTYILTAVAVLFVSFIAFYVEGWRLKPAELLKPNSLSSDVFGGLGLTIIAAVIAILHMTHEYRYNTIVYTLTASNSRSRVLLAKFITISCYAVFLTLLIGLLSPTMSYLGIHAAGHSLAPQTINYKDLVWRSLFYGWSYGVLGLLLAALIRIQVGAIVALFIIPSAIEPLLTQLLKNNAVYMPFTALNQVAGNQAVNGASLSPVKGTMVFLVYLAAGWLIAWYLFLRRDASG